jgi:uroporphyrinogen decarboxylase
MDQGFERVPVNLLFDPPFEYKVVDEDKEHRVIVDDMGIKKQIRKDETSIPRFIGWPVGSRDDWERLKSERIVTDAGSRLPADIDKLRERYRSRSFPLTIGGYPHGFFGTIRFLMGDEILFTSYYDRPDLIHDINTTLCNMWIEVYSQVLDTGIELDCVDMWDALL